MSERARRVRLVIKLDGRLEVVIPRGFSRRRIPEVVESKRDWIARATSQVEERGRLLDADSRCLPERIGLTALREEWQVEYRPSKANTVAVRERLERRLLVAGATGDFEACREALGRWLGRRARRALVARLAVLSLNLGLGYERVSIRQQRTRWGSCSHKKTISLNARLLFLPREVVDYVLIHELCHTVEMNHSPKFWALMESHDPEYRTHRRQLRDGRKAVPAWLDRELAAPRAQSRPSRPSALPLDDL